MPDIAINGAQLYYEDTGAGSTGETIVFSHGLLWSLEMFRPQMDHLRERYRCIGYDHRGQGKSGDVDVRSIGMEGLFQDAAELIEQLGLGPVHFAGLSMGGFVAMRMAARRPDLLRSLILMETSADSEPEENIGRYRAMNAVARYAGLRFVAERVMPIMFGKEFLTDPARGDERAAWLERLKNNRRSIWRAVNGVVDRDPIAPELKRIDMPTLIVVGEQDVATVPEKAERLHAAIKNSKLVRIPGAGHTSTIEQPKRVNAALDEFLGSLAH